MISAIIVAAGKGIRMNDKLRKQYLVLAGRPILAYSLLAFDVCDLIDHIILVVPKKDVDYCWKDIVSPLKLYKKINLVAGGEKRQESAYNGLMAVDKDTAEIVVIHDGVRPFVSQAQIAACITGAKEYSACIPAVPANDTLKQVDSSGFICDTLKRDDIFLAQTPQAFQYDLIIKAHKNARREGFAGTDDASLVERLGGNIKIIYGSRRNIKITNREDLIFATALL
ncbi:MAG: 2-C-methyl-D-erythritol 4-phosphate cytidylyltransferase [Desulfobacteraceae bacterium]|uniref:2-C-methyl-D-erythritol 4-phosphate cytidylyltransferase n=1 Tax=Candidatus Desulfaltia bathyphila TaxID=2841697 RepID=A0A8J6TC82_9BACT|nr:2-C-methyl-D-erythritol 4-phosphate cytidylyltransferase [Candidatus Desulfaltia bathyphila]MBL7195239.1 2-C-methyl-D-erythritol 4-phosphate cytidylyltransferase [Desulfobacterales bacterium]